MRGIFAKEWRHYFKTMTGYAFVAMYLALSGAVFTFTNLLAQDGDIKSYFSLFTTVAILLFPILTMGIFAEERKQKTDELLLTSPVTMTAIVLGKFLAMFTVFLIPMFITLIYPAVLLFYGAGAFAETAGNYAGLMLLSMACIAIGQFISLLSESQFVCAILTYAVFALLLFAGQAMSLVSHPVLKSTLSFLAITGHSNGFSYGVFDLTQLVYFLSISALFLSLSVFVLERRRLA
ncbi:MAG: ABC transporter permease subunit [Clostridiales bacterium]|nr:ABC transporter permease subunit [Clostridiales bacterium]